MTLESDIDPMLRTLDRPQLNAYIVNYNNLIKRENTGALFLNWDPMMKVGGEWPSSSSASPPFEDGWYCTNVDHWSGSSCDGINFANGNECRNLTSAMMPLPYCVGTVEYMYIVSGPHDDWSDCDWQCF